MHSEIEHSIARAEACAAEQDRLASRWWVLPARARGFRDRARHYREVVAAERACAARLDAVAATLRLGVTDP